MSSIKYILSRPRGGLNDTLTQISRCWKYAELYGRRLIIDSSLSALGLPFSEYFDILHSSTIVHSSLSSELSEKISGLTCRPSHLFGKVCSYQTRYDSKKGFLDDQTGVPVRFGSISDNTFYTDYPEQLLIYDSCGGGMEADYVLQRCSFSAELRQLISHALCDLSGRYYAVHVRNTDYLTNYRKLFRKMQSYIDSNDRLLVCSDDSTVIDYARDNFSCHILSTNKGLISSDPVGALHTSADGRNRSLACKSALIDLVALGNSSKLFFGTVDSVFDRNSYVEREKITFHRSRPGAVSGFSLLAEYLCNNKHVIGTLMSSGSFALDKTQGVDSVVRLPLSSRRSLWLANARSGLSNFKRIMKRI